MSKQDLEQRQAIALAKFHKALSDAWAPPPRLTVSEWADLHRRLSPEASAEPGAWRNSRVPHLAAVMDACGPRDTAEEIVLCASSQSGKTECLNNFVGFIIDQDPGPVLIIQPNAKPMAEAWSKDRLAPMLRDCPTLKEKTAAAKGRDSKNTITHKVFEGGQLTVGGANSPASLASRPIRYLLLDEIDRYETTKEGHAIPLATRRTQTFTNRKILKVSSPTFEGAGILAELDICDQVYEFQLPCLKCGAFQMPRMKHFQWDADELDKATYECESCKHQHPINEQYKIKALGAWQQTKHGERVKVGFYINQFASSLADWRATLSEFLVVKSDSAKLQVFVNTVLAEPWSDDEDAFDGDHLLTRPEDYPAPVPGDAVLLTAGVDIQDDRIEVYVVGWGESEEAWFIDAAQLYGNTSQAPVWDDLRDFLEMEYDHESGAKLGINSVFIDSGFRTDYVYDFCRKRGGRTMAIKGVSGESVAMVGAASQKRGGVYSKRRQVPLIPLGVDSIKAVLFSRMQIMEPGPGFIHLPAGHGLFGAEFVAQLTAEKRVTRIHRGHAVREWKQIRARNEALDCFVYAFAAMRAANPNWRLLYQQFMPEIHDQPAAPAQFKRKRRPGKQGGFAKRW